MLELCKDLTTTYLCHSNDKKRILLNLLCSNFFYDGSKIVITIKEPFKALIKFSLLKTGARIGTRHEPDYAAFAQQCLHETEIMTRLERWCA
ncbi:hypothetical protein IJ818_01255 [bacterium]|nr:hypothetical protein [bacterium]